MATHARTTYVRTHRSTRSWLCGLGLTVTVTLLGSLSAFAVPAPTTPVTPTAPASSGDAKSAWQDSSRQAEIASEQVDGARQAQLVADALARTAGSDLAAATSRVASTGATFAAADAAVAAYQARIDAFANASFRGARLSQLSVILTARSADDYLDESTVISRVAQDTQKTLTDAVVAKEAAASAQSAAESARTAAVQAKTSADRAAAVAAAATVIAQQKKSALDVAVATYQHLYNQLSTQEKAAASAAAQKIRQDSLVAAAVAQAQTELAAAQQLIVAPNAAPPGVSASVVAPVAPAVVSTTASTPVPIAPLASVTSPTVASTRSSVAASSSTSAAGGGSGSGSMGAQSGDSVGEIAARAAMTKIGHPYAYAADGPDAYDCSGLTTWAWAQAGIGIPRVSYEQANFPEVPLDQLQPGDLVTYYSPVSHVAIYVGNGMVVSAADEELGIIYVPVNRAGPDATGHRVPRG